MKLVQTNLQQIHGTRQLPKVGDIFVFRSLTDPYYFGRVISTACQLRNIMPAILIYLYNACSKEEGHLPVLRPDDLLIPPLFTNRLPWSRGYFKTIKNVRLTPWDVRSVHAFRSLSPPHIVDEHGKALRDAVEPIGEYALQSYRTIDDMISDALGIPRAPD